MGGRTDGIAAVAECGVRDTDQRLAQQAKSGDGSLVLREVDVTELRRRS
jgi:hypothetical protein